VKIRTRKTILTLCVALLLAWPVVALAVTYIFNVPITLQNVDPDALSRVSKFNVRVDVFDANNNSLGSGTQNAAPPQMGNQTVKVKVTTSAPGKSYRVQLLDSSVIGADAQKSTLTTTGTLP
jgi:hypothetical protein